MSHGHFLRALREYGVKGTFERLYKMRTLKFGRLVGTDVYGNQYFENTKDYPAGASIAQTAAHIARPPSAEMLNTLLVLVFTPPRRRPASMDRVRRLEVLL